MEQLLRGFPGRENYYAFAQFLIRESIIIIEEILQVSERVKYWDRAMVKKHSR